MKRGAYVRWTDELDSWLMELVERGLSGFDIASKFSARLGFAVSADSVYHHANELGLRVGGRSPKSYESVNEDPFACPSWLRKELKALDEPERQRRPMRMIVFGLDEEIKDSEVEQRTQAAYRELWHDYVSDVVRNRLATDAQAEQALKTIPEWFRKWAQVHAVSMYEPDKDRITRYEGSLANGASIDDVQRGLQIEGLLEEGSEFMDTSKDDGDGSDAATMLLNPSRRTEPITPGSPQNRESASRSVGDPAPTDECERCGGSPKWDTQIEEWCCGTCGCILRFQKEP